MSVQRGFVGLAVIVLALVPALPLRGGPTRTGRQSRDQEQAAEHKPQPASEEDPKKKRRAERLEAMRMHAEATNVYRLVDGKRVLCTQHPEPIMRYDWQLFGVPDATLWLWVDGGRPIAAQPILFLHRGDRLPVLYGTVSLTPSLLDVEWQWDGAPPAWSTRSGGVQFKLLPEAPKPSDNQAVRLRQMKQMHRRFSFYQVSFRGRTEHRLLPRPLYRYADRDAGLVDAAIFASSAHGTCPSILFLIELRETESDTPAWHYALQHLGNADAHALLDGKEVWSVTDRGWRAAPTGGATWQINWASTSYPLTLLDDETAPESSED